MSIKESIKKSQIDPSDIVEFYHVSNDVVFMKDFLNEGAKPIGQGLGGQKRGFYVWPTRKQAEEHIIYKDKIGLSDCSFREESDFSKDGGLLVGVHVPKQFIRYPDWQLDYETAKFLPKCLPNLFSDYSDDILKIKNFPVQTDEGVQNLCIRSITGDFFCYAGLGGGTRRKNFKLSNPDATETGLIQAICDNLYKNNESFRKKYDHLLKEVAQSGKVAIKYTGEKPLSISYLAMIKGDQKGKFEETVLYTDQKPKEKQVCPFVTAGLKIRATPKR